MRPTPERLQEIRDILTRNTYYHPDANETRMSEELLAEIEALQAELKADPYVAKGRYLDLVKERDQLRARVNKLRDALVLIKSHAQESYGKSGKTRSVWPHDYINKALAQDEALFGKSQHVSPSDAEFLRRCNDSTHKPIQREKDVTK